MVAQMQVVLSVAFVAQAMPAHLSQQTYFAQVAVYLEAAAMTLLLTLKAKAIRTVG
jgi:hypothetical protein